MHIITYASIYLYIYFTLLKKRSEHFSPFSAVQFVSLASSAIGTQTVPGNGVAAALENRKDPIQKKEKHKFQQTG